MPPSTTWRIRNSTISPTIVPRDSEVELGADYG
jgi:hypothetical protein